MKAPERFYGSEDYLHETASKICGLTDFGRGDYRAGLAVLLASMDADPRFTPKGRQLAWDIVLLTLMGRAYTEQGWKTHPEWKKTKIKKPLIITGMVRSGTTALHKLMGMDSQFQGIEHWLTTAPMPRPPWEEWPRHPAYARAREFLARIFGISPGAAHTHNIVVDEYDECIELQRQSFVSNRWTCTWYAAGYDAWWQTQNEKPSFDRYVDILRLIGCHDERRWLLKNPGTSADLAWLFEHFPDACIVQMHRHPLKAVPSIASALQYIHVAYEGEGAKIAAPLVGSREMNKWITMIERGAAARKQHEAQFIDVDHKDLHANPIKTISRIYDRFGLTLTAEAEGQIAARVKENPEGQVPHHYDLADFGLRREDILERYKGYIEAYDPKL